MNQSVSTTMPTWFLIAIGLGSIILIRMMLRFSRPSTQSAIPSISIASAIVSSWLAPTAVLVVMMGLSGSLMRDLEDSFLFAPHDQDAAPIVYNAPTLPQSSSNPRTHGAPHDAPHVAVPSLDVEPLSNPASNEVRDSGNSSAEIKLPEWLVEGDTTDGDIRTVVLTSKLWSTPEEARKELAPRAAAIVRKDFDDLHQGVFSRTSHRLLSDQDLLQFSCKKTYLERVEQDFGSFKSPMCRLWMQIELSPVVRTAIHPTWKSAVVGNRILAVGYYLSFLTLAANAIVLFTRVRTMPRGNWLFAAIITVSSMLAWGAVSVYWLRLLMR